MEILAVALMYIGGIVVFAYLIMNGHPWAALTVLALTSLIHYHKSDGKE